MDRRLGSFRTALALALAALVALPAGASAHAQPQVLRDVAPLGSYFKDRVVTSSPRIARMALSGKWYSYPTKEGTTVVAALSDAYGSTISTHVVQSYVDFLDSLEHGPELSQLRIYVAPPDEVTAECGGQEGTLACYDSTTKIMVVPGGGPDSSQDGVTTSYVIAHEYGHHIASSRNNDPFNAFQTGPKYWSSYELVCDRADKGLLAPGNEDALYRANPGEGWAETYAHLKYPEVGWAFSQLMTPDQGAYDAATRDVLNPWTHGVTKVFKGSFSGRGANTRRFSFDLTLDGRMQIRLQGPRKTNYNLFVRSNGRDEGSTKNAGSRDSLAFTAACRQSQVERVTVGVKRVRGGGPFTLRVSYAG
jgi:hypothetical protein